ncbi:hypothetical protein SBF1_8390003 [Candidatus Desulfosporosinus infrequens]|uniref:Uncharacterized protein n=1 Tax=Candidatus Desulfosporosinus infrequens TaxID=2043169 RepID=A0A2U3LUK0_9FIRM|nr:hypothetical protein SBF1_8390003 [Candidatus Desulfosporosinus infrequens]
MIRVNESVKYSPDTVGEVQINVIKEIRSEGIRAQSQKT